MQNCSVPLGPQPQPLEKTLKRKKGTETVVKKEDGNNGKIITKSPRPKVKKEAESLRASHSSCLSIGIQLGLHIGLGLIKTSDLPPALSGVTVQPENNPKQVSVPKDELNVSSSGSVSAVQKPERTVKKEMTTKESLVEVQKIEDAKKRLSEDRVTNQYAS